MNYTGIINILNDYQTSIGTGFFVSADGNILTCMHVIKSLQSNQIYFKYANSPKIHTAEVLFVDTANDLALLHTRILPKFWYQATTNIENKELYTLGFPNNSMHELIATPHFCDYIENEKFIQLNNANSITSGFSGAPLLTINNTFLGVISHVPNNNSYNRLENIAFAIPSRTIIKCFSNYIKEETFISYKQNNHTTPQYQTTTNITDCSIDTMLNIKDSTIKGGLHFGCK